MELTIHAILAFNDLKSALVAYFINYLIIEIYRFWWISNSFLNLQARELNVVIVVLFAVDSLLNCLAGTVILSTTDM